MSQVKRGSTGVLVEVFIRNASSTSGQGATGLTPSSTGLAARFYKSGQSASVAITLATGTLGTWASGLFKEVDGTNMKGLYQLGLPNTALSSTGAATSRWTDVTIQRTGNTIVPMALRLQLVDFDPRDGTRLGLTALPNAAAAAANGLPVVGGTGDSVPVTTARDNSNTLVAGLGTDSKYLLSTDAQDLKASLHVNARRISDSSGAADSVESNIGNLNATVSSRSSHSAADVWTSATRTLSTAGVDAIKSNVWTNTTRTLSTAGTDGVRNSMKALVVESQGSVTFGQAQSIMLAALAGVTTGTGSTYKLKTPNGSAVRVATVLGTNNERDSVTLTPST